MSKDEMDEINELLKNLLESRKQIDNILEQLKAMEKNLKRIKTDILHTMNYLAGRLSELKEASEE